MTSVVWRRQAITSVISCFVYTQFRKKIFQQKGAGRQIIYAVLKRKTSLQEFLSTNCEFVLLQKLHFTNSSIHYKCVTLYNCNQQSTGSWEAFLQYMISVECRALWFCLFVNRFLSLWSESSNVWFVVIISMFWHRQAIFESKGDKLSSSAECRIRTQGLRNQIANGLNACWQTDWAIEDQAKNLNSTARPYDQRAFSPLVSSPTASWLSHLALVIYMFVVIISMLGHRQAIFE